MLLQDDPRRHRYEHYLDVGDDGGEPGTDEVDGVMPCREVGGKEKPGGDGDELSTRYRIRVEG